MNLVWWEAENGYINTVNVVQVVVDPTPLPITKDPTGTEVGAPYRLRVVNVLGESVSVPGEYETKEQAMDAIRKMLAG